MLAVPLLDVLHLGAGAKVGLTVADGQLVVAPAARPKYSLDELLRQCETSNEPSSAEDREWLAGGPVGELI